MVDVAKCDGGKACGKNCDKKDTCFRYLAKSSEWQSYILIKNPNDCDHYWRVLPEQVEHLNKLWQD